MSLEIVTEGTEARDLDPQPSHWPVCIMPRTKKDPTVCETPFVRRVGLSWTTGRYKWAWMRDCKHKGPMDDTTTRIHHQEPAE